jgi:lipopolysaccharide export system permease protein
MNWLGLLNPWRRSRLETYVLTACITMFASSLLILASIVCLFDYIGISKTFASRTDLSGLDILGLIAEKSPTSILFALPFAFLFGSMFAFVNLNRRSELIAMRAAGVSAWRFVTPAAISAFLFGVLTITVLNPVASHLQDMYDQAAGQVDANAPQQETVDGDASTPQKPADTAIYLRQGDGKSQTVIRAVRQDPAAGKLFNATFWVYKIDSDETPKFVERLDAGEATLRPGKWELRNAWDVQPEHQSRFYDVLTIDSNINPKDAFRKFVSTQSVSLWQLPGMIYHNARSGVPTTQYRLKLWQLLATPLLFAAMSMLGAVFSLRLMRLGGMTWLFISGVSLGFVIFFVNQLFGSMGKADLIPVFLAGWTPPVLALLSAMTLLVYTEDG